MDEGPNIRSGAGMVLLQIKPKVKNDLVCQEFAELKKDLSMAQPDCSRV